MGYDEPTSPRGERQAARAEPACQASSMATLLLTNEFKGTEVLEDILGSRSRESLGSKQYIKSQCSKTAKPGQIFHSKGKKIQTQYQGGKQADLSNAGKELIALNTQSDFGN